MKTRLIQTTTKGQHQSQIANLLAKGYVIVDRSETQIVLQRRTAFNGIIFFLGCLFFLAGAFLYVAYFAMKRLGDELVTVELIQP